MEHIGTLTSLHRYPFKGMAGESLEEAFVTYSGLQGDRVWAFLDSENHSSFPWMTARIGREMLRFVPRFIEAPPADEEHPDALSQYRARVTTPEGETFDADSRGLRRHLEKRFGRPLTLRFSDRGMHDCCPVSILGLSTVQALSRECELELDPLRFRANFYVQWDTPEPFFEDTLVERRLQIGDKLALMVVKKDARCVIINLEPKTAEPSPVVLEKVARGHRGRTGVYATVLHHGKARCGDPILAY
jgi:uncharacterized protein YcbX